MEHTRIELRRCGLRVTCKRPFTMLAPFTVAVPEPVIEDLRRDQAASNRPTLAGVLGRPVDEDGSVQVAEELRPCIE